MVCTTPMCQHTLQACAWYVRTHVRVHVCLQSQLAALLVSLQPIYYASITHPLRNHYASITHLLRIHYVSITYPLRSQIGKSDEVNRAAADHCCCCCSFVDLFAVSSYNFCSWFGEGFLLLLYCAAFSCCWSFDAFACDDYFNSNHVDCFCWSWRLLCCQL
jgi:hypothetical protein